ncbi:efflux RND transporter permease subunit [Aliikangiella coralliicola]|uniref:Efflux RND transporter permease subunit n=1 Tax=Aliikangiella coralliicola TaxID=2592383 RepID=A0A545U929_9GAMM|nr:efflux RND transporter permease subunit [Aliikangiella coralliicola]TQV85974.1 efflux RND transporter permease subunit [Aliikangiella coralliicola]
MKTTRPNSSLDLIRLFAEHPVAPNMMMVIMILLGFWGLSQINTQLNPSQTYNSINVSVEWPGASAEDIERMITRPIEYQLRQVKNLQEIRSSTRNGMVTIQLDFVNGSDNSESLDAVKQGLAEVRHLPADMEPASIRPYVRYERVTDILVTGSATVSELAPLAQSFERDLLSRGVDKVEFISLPQSEMVIQVGSQTMLDLRMSLVQISARIKSASTDAPAGAAGKGESARQLRSLDERRNVESFNRLPIQTGDNQQLVLLGDIAQINNQYRDDSVATSQNSRPAIWMRVLRAPGTDTLEAAAIVQQWKTEAQNNLPSGIEITTFLETWKFTQQQIDLVLENGVLGLVLVMLTLFLFLSTRVAWWVALGIPLSFLAALTLFYFCGGSINVLSMVGLVMALGIVVDDAIVVGERTQTLLDQGDSPVRAATFGAKGMFSPVMASSLTTLAAFIPLMIVDGGAMREVPILMACIIVFSLVECFLVLPGHLRNSFSRKQSKPTAAYRLQVEHWFKRFREHYFLPLLRRALAFRFATLCVALAAFIFALSLLISGHIKPELIVSFEQDYIEANLKVSSTAKAHEVNKLISDIENAMLLAEQDVGDEIILSHVISKGMATITREKKRGQAYNQVLVELTSPDSRDVDVNQFAEAWRKLLPKSPLIESLQLKVGDDFSSDISIYFQGNDLANLKSAAEAVKSILASYPGVRDVNDDLPYGKEQWIFSLNTQGRELGLTAAAIGQQIYSAYNGVRIQIFNQGDQEIEVLVKLPEAEITNLFQLGQFPVRTQSGEMVTLSSVATISSQRGLEVIQHHNAQLAVNIVANVDNRENTPMSILSDFEENVVPKITKDYQLSYGLSENSRAEQQIINDLLMGVVIGLALIYVILCWNFSSYLWPLAVMSAIPLALTGALFGLQLFQVNLGVLSTLGLFTLSGVIVNDSIILVNDYKIYRDRGIEVNTAIEQAVNGRLRPVILTSLTTSVGLLPMLFESSLMGAFMAPLAIVICFGLIYGTLLILLVIPALLSMLETVSLRWLNKNSEYGAADNNSNRNVPDPNAPNQNTLNESTPKSLPLPQSRYAFAQDKEEECIE